MDLAEAMLRPVDDEELQRADGTPALELRDTEWLTEPLFAAEFDAARPHRRAARLDRQRRAGAIARTPQPCSSPLPQPVAPAHLPRLTR